MKHDWEYKKLGEVAEIIGGSTPKTNIKEYWDGDYFWITPAELKGDRFIKSTSRTITDLAVENTNLSLLPKGTVLLSSRAPIGKVAIADVPMYCNQGFKNIICGEKLNNNYVYWLLYGKTEYLNSLGVGATFKEISKKIVENIPIPLPPLSTQQSIVSELDSLSKIIADCKETLKDYDALEQSIFYDMFGDPVKNDKGWEVKKLGEVCSKITDGVHSKPKYVESGVPFVSVKDITTGELIMDDVKYISKEDHIQYSKRCPIEFGDVLYTKVGATYGRPALVNVKDEFSLYVSVALLKPIHKVVNNQFLCKQLSTDFVKRQADSSIKGIGVPDLHLNMIKNFVVLVPPMHLQLSFNEKIEAIEQMKEETKKALQEAETLFQARMDYWFN